MKPSRVTIVSVGTELTEGRNLDTNSQWLAAGLTRLGLDVRCHVTLSDRQQDLEDFLRSSTDSVLMTGGIGPTVDDRTRLAVSKALSANLRADGLALADLQAHYQRRGRAVPEHALNQVLIPEGFEALLNPYGTATAFWKFVGDGRFLAFLPGVPREMRPLFSEFVGPRLCREFGLSHYSHLFELHTFGSFESHLNDLIGDLLHDDEEITSSILVDDYEIMMRWRPRNPAARDRAHDLWQQAKQRLGPLVFLEREGDNGTLERIPDPLAVAVVHGLAEQGLKAAFAESCTGGLAAGLLTEVPGSSAVFETGIVAYHNRTKIGLLGVPAELLGPDGPGAVSRDCVEAMAAGLARLSQADLNISVSGIAGPASDDTRKPVGMVCFGMEREGERVSYICQFNGTRDQVRHRSARCALNLIRLALLTGGLPPDEVVPYQIQP